MTSIIQPLEKLPRWLVWQIAIPLTILNGWLLFKVFQALQAPITLLIAATLLSFLLNYPVELLTKLGLRRGPSVLIIFLLTLGTLALLGSASVPILATQLTEIGNNLPIWLDSGSEQFQVLDSWLTAHRIPLDTSALVGRLADVLPEELSQLPDQIFDLLLGAVDGLIGVLVIAVLTLYMLLHGREFWYGLIRWLPGHWGLEVRVAMKDQFKNYFVGQATIAGLMAAILTTVFFVLKIPFWLVLGLGIGTFVLIPFGDTVAVLAASLLLSFQSVWLGVEVFLITLVVDQLIDQAVAPRILGNLVGVNPVWVILSLLVGAQFGGVLGLVIAVPLAGSIKRIFNDSFPIDNLLLDGEVS
jgi:predicted PurR-regulated permease PerM